MACREVTGIAVLQRVLPMQIMGLALATLMPVTPVVAESLPIEWAEAPSATEVAFKRNVAIGPFSGSDGFQLARVFEALLAEARGRTGNSYYRIYRIDRSRPPNDLDAIFGGFASAAIDERRVQQKRRYCVGQAKPTTNCKEEEKEEREVTCRIRVIELVSELEAEAVPGGRLLYSRRLPHREEFSWCPGDQPPADRETVVARMIRSAAEGFARDMTPVWRSGSVRVLENRKGLTKAQSERFKLALRMTKSNVREACKIFDELEAEIPSQRSVVFNAALCAEMRGDRIDALKKFELLGGYSGAAFAAQRIHGTLQVLSLEQERLSPVSTNGTDLRL